MRRSTTPTTSAHRYGPIARWTDSSNYLRGDVYRDNANLQFIYLFQRVAGSDSTLAGPVEIQPSEIANGVYYRLRLIVFASGRAIFQVFDAVSTRLIKEIEATSTALATGGALASGKPGFHDQNQSANTIDRHFDNFAVATPAPEPVVIYPGRSLEITGADVLREDSTGTYWGRPPSYRGSRFLLPVGTNRVFVKAAYEVVETAAHSTTTVPLEIQTSYVPRGLAVPRS